MVNTAKNPYEVLGLTPSASEDEVTSAYRKLAKKYHPDANPDDQSTEKKMQEINAAYESIKNGDTGGSFAAGPNPYSGSSTQSSYGNYGGYTTYSYSGDIRWEDLFGENGPFSAFSSYFSEFESGAQAHRGSNLETAEALLRSHRFQDALVYLNQETNKTAHWHYLYAYAQSNLGRHNVALEHAAEAVRMSPQTQAYRSYLHQLQNQGFTYTRTVVRPGFGLQAVGKVIIWMMVIQMLLSFLMRLMVFG